MAFTVARLVERLQITEEQAQRIIGVIRGKVSPFEVPSTAAWRKQCYHDPDPAKPETRMHAIDGILGTFGTEAIWGRSCTQPVAEYCNTGETYDSTILYDYVNAKYRLTSWGDWVEAYGDRYGVQ
jgi:hypothetical protein